MAQRQLTAQVRVRGRAGGWVVGGCWRQRGEGGCCGGGRHAHRLTLTAAPGGMAGARFSSAERCCACCDKLAGALSGRTSTLPPGIPLPLPPLLKAGLPPAHLSSLQRPHPHQPRLPRQHQQLHGALLRVHGARCGPLLPAAAAADVAALLLPAASAGGRCSQASGSFGRLGCARAA